MNTEQMKQFLVSSDCIVVEAMQKIDSNARGILFVVDDARRITGVLTDGDIRRWIIKTGNLQMTVEHMMNRDPKVIHRKDIPKAKEYMVRHSITALPVVDAQGTLEDIIFRENKPEINDDRKKSLADIPVVVMAGGKGTRLYPYTKILPKPLIPIGDIPIMERIINRFSAYGIRKFYATVNYKKSMIKSYFSDLNSDYEVCYVEEDVPLGTAGSLHLIKEDFGKPFFVTNCDILIDADYADIYKYHKQAGNELTIVTSLKNIVVPYGVVHSSVNGTVNSMEEKPKISYFVNTGMYVMNPRLIKMIPENTFFHMTDLTDILLKEGGKVGMYPISEDSFLDMGEFEEMHRMEEKLSLKSE